MSAASSRGPGAAGAREQASAAPDPWEIMQPVRGQIRLGMGFSALAAACSLGALAALAWAVHGGLMALVASAPVAAAAPALGSAPSAVPWLPLALAVALTLVAAALRLASFNQSHYAAFKLETRLRSDLAAHVARMPLGAVQSLGAAALTKILLEDVKALHVFVADSTPLYARAYVSPLLSFALLLALDWRLTLAATGVLAVGLAALMLALRGREELQRRYHEEGENVSRAVVEYVQAMPVVRTFDTGTTTFARYQNALNRFTAVVLEWYHAAGRSSRMAQAVLGPLPTLAALLWLGAWCFGGGTLAPGTWLAALLIGTGMAESLLPLMALKHLIARTQMSVRRIQQVLAAPELPSVAVRQEQVPRGTQLCFERVGFRYSEGGPQVLQDISFSAAPGTVTALVGPSGAGKTTVARLIPRFWDVSAGRITIGGVDLRDMLPDTLMQQVAFVFQDTFLFADTIAENIRLGLPEATREQVEAAARAAQAHDFIMALPQGYDTAAGERGIFLSGGQRQRITIARAILQNRPILVLDEATAFADPENEAALIAALAQLMRGKTVLIVAHRLSTIRDADQILVFDQGRLVERGQHAPLLAEGGLYARLWQNHERAQGWTLGRRASA